MTLSPNGYIPRIIDTKIARYLQTFGAISIEGPKWCGKTWTSLNHANSVFYLMDPANNYSNRELARINPALMLDGDYPRAIDEWQEVPGIWDAVRFRVDQQPEAGSFILTGSATPPSESYRHSGVGRMALIKMSPMTLFESGDSTGEISFASILNAEPIPSILTNIDLPDLIDLTIRGGWPQTLKLSLQAAADVSSEYINVLTRNELFDDNNPRRDPDRLRRFLRSLARNNATLANDSILAADVGVIGATEQAAKEPSLTRNTVKAYIDDLRKIFVIDEIPAWDANLRSRSRLRKTPKRIFCDPSLAVQALSANRESLLTDLNTYGFLFENLVLRDLSVYATAADASLYHYRDNSGLEADAIIEHADGAWSAFEVKLGAHRVDAAATSLLRLRDKIVAGGAEPPRSLAVITGGGIGQLRDDGVYVVPINALRP